MWRRVAALVLLVAPLSFHACTCPRTCTRGENREVALSELSTEGIASLAELDVLLLPALPDWTDKYGVGGRWHFDLDVLMAVFSLTRLQAVELQNHFADAIRADPTVDRVHLFNASLARVRVWDFESGLDPQVLADAEFIVVFDLDSTLLDQYRAGESCHDFAIDLGDRKRHVKLVPHWEQAFRRIHELGGRIVLFSANRDQVVLTNLEVWLLDGRPLLQHEWIDGVLTNSYLIRQHKYQGIDRETVRKDGPVVLPAKDLRILDPSLTRVVIVDDNPTRLFQDGNVRVFKKFRADVYCGASDGVFELATENALPAFVDEVEESVAFMRRNDGVDFVTAYRPYTAPGQVAVQLLVDSGMTRDEAIDYLRAHPEVIDRTF